MPNTTSDAVSSATLSAESNIHSIESPFLGNQEYLTFVNTVPGWRMIFLVLEEMYRQEELYYFLTPEYLKEKFGLLEIFISTHSLKFNNSIENISYRDFVQNFKNEVSQKLISNAHNLPNLSQRINSARFEEVLEKIYLHHCNSNSQEREPTLAFGESYGANGEYWDDDFLKILQFKNFCESARTMSSVICMHCSNLGFIAAHQKPQSNYLSSNCAQCSALFTIEQKKVLAPLQMQIKSFDFIAMQAYQFLRNHEKAALEVLAYSNSHELFQRPAIVEYLQHSRASSHHNYNYNRLQPIAELFNFIIYRDKYLHSSERLGDAVIFLLLAENQKAKLIAQIQNASGLEPGGTDSSLSVINKIKLLNLFDKLDLQRVLPRLERFSYDYRPHMNNPFAFAHGWGAWDSQNVAEFIDYARSSQQKSELNHTITKSDLPSVKIKI